MFCPKCSKPMAVSTSQIEMSCGFEAATAYTCEPCDYRAIYPGSPKEEVIVAPPRPIPEVI